MIKLFTCGDLRESREDVDTKVLQENAVTPVQRDRGGSSAPQDLLVSPDLKAEEDPEDLWVLRVLEVDVAILVPQEEEER
jgi:hypothetical protein